MNVTEKISLLGGISPQVFAQRYWQKKPLLVRQAIPGGLPLLDRRALLIWRPVKTYSLVWCSTSQIGNHLGA